MCFEHLWLAASVKLFPGHRLWRGKPIQLFVVRIFDPLLCVSSSGFLSIKWKIKIRHFINIQLKIGRTAKNIPFEVCFVMRHVPFSGRRHTQFLCTWEKWINSWFPTFHLVGYVERFPSHSLLFLPPSNIFRCTLPSSLPMIFDPSQSIPSAHSVLCFASPPSLSFIRFVALSMLPAVMSSCVSRTLSSCSFRHVFHFL